MRTRRRLLALTVTLAAVFAAAAPAQAKRLVRYDVSGGLAGTSVTLVVNAGGAARQTGSEGGHRFTVSAGQLRALRRELREARFSSLKRTYQPDRQILDGITQSVAYGGRRVSIYTGAEVPTRLSRVIRRLDRLTRSD